MSMTARLALPYIAPQQAQKQVTYNEAMATLDILVQPVVKSRSVTTPPGGPADGDCYIVAPSATGVWAGRDGKLARWLGAGWDFVDPSDGWLAFVEDVTEIAVCQAGAWAALIAAETFEEGSWTPALQFGGATTGITYAARTGRFTRIGRQVTVTAKVTLSSKGSATGAAKIAGLPFASLNDGVPSAVAVASAANFSGLTGALLGQIESNTVLAALHQAAAGGATALSNAEFTNSTDFAFTATYDAA